MPIRYVAYMVLFEMLHINDYKAFIKHKSHLTPFAYFNVMKYSIILDFAKKTWELLLRIQTINTLPR